MSRSVLPSFFVRRPCAGARRSAAILAALAALAVAAPVSAASAPVCANPITSCPCRIIAPGSSYVVLQNLVTTGGGDCIRIRAADVTLDLGSAMITGAVQSSATIGVHVFPEATDTVVEGTAGAPAVVQFFGTGVQVDAHGVTLKNLTAQSNNVGIVIQGGAAYGNTLSALDNTQVGILIRNVGAGPFLDNIIVSNTAGPGIKLNNVQGASLANVTATANHTYGVWLRSSSHNLIADFTASQNTTAGIYVGCYANGGLLNRACDPSVAPSNGNILAGLATPARVFGPVQPNQEYGVVIGKGNGGNRVVDVTGSTNGTGFSGADGADYNPDCGGDIWRDNQFATTIPSGSGSCIR